MDDTFVEYLKSLDSKNISDITADLIDSLSLYVNKFDVNDILIETIKTNLTKSVESMTVYRGQDKSFLLGTVPWFSTSKNKKIAQDYFTNGKCCLFTIHLVNIPILDVYSIIEKGDFAYEEEIIVLGGGTFYKNKDLTIKGFTEIETGHYETWYSFISQKTVEELFNQILPEEYEFIDTIDDIVLLQPIDDNVKNQILTMIKAKKNLNENRQG